MPSLKQVIGNNQHISKDDVCFLLSSTTVVDDLLQEIEITLPELVYCAPVSIGQREFSIAAQAGLKAQLTLIIDYDEYDGEKEVEYNLVKYSVYRTFVRNDGDIELYCEVRKGGN
ncbi:hypothetical protein [Lysinibacillus xylanilyticus]|uniref:Phage head-tail adapter protein n=1 Tax=Lysinibacillus xylanilyticus TaxID=582475 RepID=A0ABT4ENQ5_9BACI|nr:hypothetical protein [Lysinibacillus xylanilyticus]MCY9547292.1 hypothetical protein [Lysinibacillus xylanilyticus]